MLKAPKVSILLPNLNNYEFLTERFECIINQTFEDWELIVVDNYSDDGAWDLIQSFADKDNRIKATQAPKMGMYANWNNCIKLAKGEYIYIATSDDTMSLNFLEVMCAILDRELDCDLAHCNLTVIDESGENILPNPWDTFYSSQFYSSLLHLEHKRLAPLDGYLHCFLFTIYTSITQLLIRRSLFNKIGLFSTNYGSIADMLWEMKASLVANTIHVPQYLATWRRHSNQATMDNMFKHPKIYEECISMIEEALSDYTNAQIKASTEIHSLKFTYRNLALFYGLNQSTSKYKKILFVFNYLKIDFVNTLKFILNRYVKGESTLNQIEVARNWVQRNKLNDNIIVLKS